MEKFQQTIVLAGDVGTYKAVLCRNLKRVLNRSGIHCTISMKDDAVTDAFNVFVTTSKSEFHTSKYKQVLNQYDLVLDIDKMTEEEALACTVEVFVKWMN